MWVGSYEYTQITQTMEKGKSVPVWTDNGLLECDGDSYSINGKAVSNEEAKRFAEQALNAHRATL